VSDMMMMARLARQQRGRPQTDGIQVVVHDTVELGR
jgi:hypothetical protein